MSQKVPRGHRYREKALHQAEIAQFARKNERPTGQDRVLWGVRFHEEDNGSKERENHIRNRKVCGAKR